MAKEDLVNEKTIMTSRHYVRVVAFVVFVISLGAYLMYEAYPYIEVRSAMSIPPPPADSDDEVAQPYALTRELPTRLRIPKLSIDTTFEEPLALAPDGTIGVPDSFDKVGWYKLGAAPGEIGTASILGHVDSYQGAAVFYSLGQLAPGDRIFIERQDGVEAEFEVLSYERYRQDEFPTEKVYTMTPYPSLRLITCSGTYVKGKARYTHNLVVYARLVK